MTDDTNINVVYRCLTRNQGCNAIEIYNILKSEGVDANASSVRIDLSELARYNFARKVKGVDGETNCRFVALKRDNYPSTWLAEAKKTLLRRDDGERCSKSTIERRLLGYYSDSQMFRSAGYYDDPTLIYDDATPIEEPEVGESESATIDDLKKMVEELQKQVSTLSKENSNA